MTTPNIASASHSSPGIGAAKRSLHDSPECGDAFGFWPTADAILLCVVDGLGHGHGAAVAARAALRCVEVNKLDPLDAIFFKCNAALTSTRGAAMSLALVHNRTGVLQFAGVGNVRVALGRLASSSLRNTDGIVGGGYASLAIERAQLAPGDLIIMYTDGFPSRLNIKGYDSAVIATPSRLAQTLLHEQRRGTDDAAVLVYQYKLGHGP